jgi:hypothetical protein
MSDFILFLNKQKDGQMEKILPSEYEEEKRLQNLIKEYPEMLPSIFSTRIITLTDEYVTDTGPIDIVCVDDNGRLYLIETKLQSNYDKRQVIAQLIDYATQLGKESFDRFQSKIRERTGKTLQEILLKLGEDSVTENLSKIKHNLSEKNFVLIVAMDRIEQTLKDAIIFLNQDNEMDIFGLELPKYNLGDYGAEFIPIVTPSPDIPRSQPSPKIPITIEEFVSNYSAKGLSTEISTIMNAFKAEINKGNAQFIFTPAYLIFDIGEKQIQVTLNKDAEKSDHGVWVFNPMLYDKILELGVGLEFQAKKSSSQNFAKIIQFNGSDGIKKLAKEIGKLIAGLIDVYHTTGQQ